MLTACWPCADRLLTQVANSTGLGANGTEHGRTMSIVFRGTDTSHNLMIDG